MFQIFCNIQLIRYKAGSLHPLHLMVKHLYKIYVWDAFCHQGLIGIVLFTGKMNSIKYHEILQFQLLPKLMVLVMDGVFNKITYQPI